MFQRNLLLLGLFGLALSLASGSLLARDINVAVVKAARLLEESPQAEAVTKRLKREFAKREQELIEHGEKLKRLTNRRRRDGQVMSDSQLTELEKDILSAQRKLKNGREEFRQDLSIRRNEELQKLNKVISEVIRQIAKRQRIDMVLEVEVGGVVFADKRVDLTDTVLDHLRQQAKR